MMKNDQLILKACGKLAISAEKQAKIDISIVFDRG